MKAKLAAIVGMIAALLVGCADQRKETEVFREDVLSKQMIPEDVDYLYLPSVVDSPRTSKATRPYWMGEAKRVRFQYDKDELKVFEVETDPRFKDNVTNNKPIMRIPIANKDYKCKEDAYGDCLPSETENEDISWKAKRFFQPEFKKVKFEEVNFLPIEITNLFESCYKETGSDFVGHKVEKDAINFSIEKSFQITGDCLGDIESLSDVSFKVRYHYSFAKLDKLSTPDYKPFVYPVNEENTFGFFNTRQFTLDVDNNSMEGGEFFHLNRWHPKRTVTYHLNKAFNKPENKAIKESTYESIESINNTLKAAGAELRVELKDHDPNVEAGDLRYNTIVLVEDPQATGIIGYGPSAANPITGEIVHARTVMYLGTMKKFLQASYDELVEEKRAQGSSSGVQAPSVVALNGVSRETENQSEHNHMHLHDMTPSRVLASGKDFGGRRISEDKIKELVSNPTKLVELSEDFRQRLEVLSRHTAYSGLLFNFHGAIEADIDEVLKKTQMKPWSDLSAGMKKYVVDKLMPFVWAPTFIHEIGHNLGLRHNFGGSEDKENFFTDEELTQIGAKRKFKGSSIMDYAYKTTNELRTMGKYDIAALRYAYSEKVETADGKMISVDKMRAESGTELRAYRFCTDEHVDANPTCNRFDEGTNLTEIAQHWIKLYENRYKTRNFRNSRLSFSLAGDITQIMFLNSVFRNFRLSFERFESIKNDYDLAEENPIWEQNGFLKDLKTSTLVGGKFLTDLLKVPDLTCAIVAVAKPNEIVAAVPLRDLSTNAITCFDKENVGLNPAYKVAAEGGKSFNSLKSPYSNNPYVDQIDVRGIWIDKLMALNTLLQRGLGSPTFDDYTENYLHLSDLRPELVKTLEGIMLDSIEAEVPYRTENGEEFTIKYSYPLASTHTVNRPLISAVRNFFGIGSEPVPFQHLLIRTIKRHLPSEIHFDKTKDVLEAFSSLATNKDHKPDEVKTLEWGAERFFATKENTLAVKLMTRISMQLELGLVDEKQLTAAVQKLAAMPTPVASTPLEERIIAFGVSEVISMLSGELQAPSTLVAVLRELRR